MEIDNYKIERQKIRELWEESPDPCYTIDVEQTRWLELIARELCIIADKVKR